MAEKDKRYYWLKLKRDFFKRHDIQIIEGMPNGKDYILFYLKLLCESVDHDGNLRFSEQIPYNEGMLATITNTNIDIVRSAIKIFTELHMMEIMDDGTFYMNEVEKMLGSETYWAKKKREQKERELNGQTGVGNFPTLSNEIPTSPSKSIDIDKELDIDIDIDSNVDKKKEEKPKKPVRHKHGEYKNVLLTDEDMGKLKKEFPYDWEERIEKLSSYMASTGKSYKNHLATIRNWARKEPQKPLTAEQIIQRGRAAAQRILDIKEKESAKTVANDEDLKARADALKQQFGQEV